MGDAGPLNLPHRFVVIIRVMLSMCLTQSGPAKLRSLGHVFELGASEFERKTLTTTLALK